MIPRLLASKLTDYAKKMPVIGIVGPRQSGKTTLAKACFPDYPYISMEDMEAREFASHDPKAFFKRYPLAIIDEIQKVPELLSSIQIITDESGKKGQYVITGSHQLFLLEKVSQTLAGRIALFDLLPLSIAELDHRKAFSFDEISAWKLPKKTKSELNKLLFSGMYPRIHDANLEPTFWYDGYYRTYVERDVRDITQIGDLLTFQRFVKLCAGRSGQLLNMSELATDTGVSHTTIRQWLSVLQVSGLVFLLQPYFKNFSKRLVKTPKLYFYDTGLLCYLLGLRSPNDLDITPFRGHIFETFIVSDIIKNFLNQGQSAPVYFWRDHSGHEIDLIIDQGINQILIEIKNSGTYRSEFIQHLKYFKTLETQTVSESLLIYAGDESYERTEAKVLSWNRL